MHVKCMAHCGQRFSLPLILHMHMPLFVLGVPSVPGLTYSRGNMEPIVKQHGWMGPTQHPCWHTKGCFTPMIGKNRQLVTNEAVDFEK